MASYSSLTHSTVERTNNSDEASRDASWPNFFEIPFESLSADRAKIRAQENETKLFSVNFKNSPKIDILEQQTTGQMEKFAVFPSDTPAVKPFTTLPKPTTSEKDGTVGIPTICSSTQSHKSSSLHGACICASDKDIFIIIKMLQIQPHAASNKVFLSKTRTFFNCAKKKMETKAVQEQYGYAINLAIKNRHIKKTEIFERIIEADPSVVAKPDGPNHEGTLHCLIRHRPNEVELADYILLQSPKVARMKDKKGNTPLHIAAFRPYQSLDLIRHLVILYPKALMERNLYGQTPLDLIMYQSLNPVADTIADYFREKMLINQNHQELF